MIRGEGYWTYDPEAEAWYFGLNERRPGPYRTQREVMAIVDIADDGTLAGIELLEAIQPPGPRVVPASRPQE